MAAATATVASTMTSKGASEKDDITEIVSRLMVIVAVSLTCILAFFVRIFSVIKFESMIHEFDPHFNFRVAKYMVKHVRIMLYSIAKLLNLMNEYYVQA